MTIRTDLVGQELFRRDVSWTTRDTLTYALTVGAGVPDPGAELQFTTENTYGVAQQVLPTFLVVMGMGSGENVSTEMFGDFPLSSVVQGEQRIVARAPIPPAGEALATTRMSAVYDKGKNAIIETTTTFTLRDNEEPLGETVGQMVVRGAGGFGGDPGPSTTWQRPHRPADHQVLYETSPAQALLYRLNGDNNPLHSDPRFAERAGFERPILHGLCTYGFAARALISTLFNGDARRLQTMAGRFSSPVVPGEKLTVHLWAAGDGYTFQVRVGERVVLDRGTVTGRAAALLA